MQIHGLNKTTLLDYPGYVAATVFTGGCNFRCPFCHNKNLVLTGMGNPLISEEEIFGFLKKRAGILKGVCITGGEPTLQTDLPDFIRKVKALGYLVKLDTNGSNPEVLKELLLEGLLDYVAMDVKNAPTKYAMTTGMDSTVSAKIVEPVSESIDLLLHANIDYEFRTTVVKELHTIEDIAEIAKWIKGAKAYYLQSYRENENVLQSGFSAYEKTVLEEMKNAAGEYLPLIQIRGVE